MSSGIGVKSEFLKERPGKRLRSSPESSAPRGRRREQLPLPPGNEPNESFLA